MRAHLIIATCTLVLGIGAPLSQAALIFSENFDGVPTGTYSVGQAVGNFTVGTGTVDVVGLNFAPFLCSGAATGNCVDLDGNSQGSLTSGGLNLGPGNYTLSFVLNGSQRGTTSSATVSLGAAFSNTYTLASGDTNSFVIPFTVLVAQSDPLTFVSNTPGAIGAILDAVTLTGPLSTAPTPEPSASWLVGTGLVAATLLSRRYRKA